MTVQTSYLGASIPSIVPINGSAPVGVLQGLRHACAEGTTGSDLRLHSDLKFSCLGKEGQASSTLSHLGASATALMRDASQHKGATHVYVHLGVCVHRMGRCEGLLLWL